MKTPGESGMKRLKQREVVCIYIHTYISDIYIHTYIRTYEVTTTVIRLSAVFN